MNTFPIQIRREFWEHRSLWMAPLIWVAIITVMFTWVIFVVIPEHGEHRMVMQLNAETMAQLTEEERRHVEEAMKLPAERGQTVYAFSYLAVYFLITSFTSVVLFFYLIDCLYAERRDRSILFWKSLPISDTQVVLSKLAVAMIVVPLGIVAVSAVTQLVLFAEIWLKFRSTVVGAVMPDWSLLAWLKSLVMALGLELTLSIWYAPIVGYLLLVSSWARKNVFLWAVLPPLSLAALEGFFLRSGHVAEFLGRRFGGYIDKLRIDTSIFNTGTSDQTLPRVDDVFGAFDISGVLLSAEAWVGMVAAAAMIYAAIRLRRYRDDS